jgi:hypothetical protein
MPLLTRYLNNFQAITINFIENLKRLMYCDKFIAIVEDFCLKIKRYFMKILFCAKEKRGCAKMQEILD